MARNVTRWTRLTSHDLPVYVLPDGPEWFVPNRSGDELLRRLQSDPSRDPAADALRFLDRLPDGSPSRYSGRSDERSLDRLSELWLHVTDRCNLACRHCLVGCAPGEADELSADRALHHARQAADAGCRVFAITGGEPLMHPGLQLLLEGLLNLPHARVAMLTNGTLLTDRLEMLTSVDKARLHLQVSMDGLEDNHDRIRGRGAWQHLTDQVSAAVDANLPLTLSMCVDASNVDDIPEIVRYAGQVGIANVHFLWFFVRGRARRQQMPDLDRLFSCLVQAADAGRDAGVSIDNLDAVASQVFAPPRTIHDGTGAGWDSLALGPGEQVYPSAATVGISELSTHARGDLLTAWRESPTLQRVRQATIAGGDRPMRRITGGGDMDQSYTFAGSFVGDDPYLPLIERLALWLIEREATRQSPEGRPALRLKMGDILETCGDGGRVAMTHSNCLLSLAEEGGQSAVKRFYASAAATDKTDILNPVAYPQELMDHIPPAHRFRGYGCGSPVIDAALQPGETAVDLGCGTGVECYLAARAVGGVGQVVGVDMLEQMLDRARRGSRGVAENLGYDNLRFVQGYLEDLPLPDACADVVLSNCVLNLSTHKRKLFGEIRRILRPGGRIVASDVVTETDPGPTIRNDETLRGECLGGALTQKDLVGLLDESGFTRIEVLRRAPYRTVRGHAFYSMTFRAFRPEPVRREHVQVMYRGPMESIATREGTILRAGCTTWVRQGEIAGLTGEVLVLDDRPADPLAASSCCCGPSDDVSSQTAGSADTAMTFADRLMATEASACCCGSDSGATGAYKTTSDGGQASCSPALHTCGCMVCGLSLEYSRPREVACEFCCNVETTEAICPAGHYVCDACHSRNALEVVTRICLNTRETDMVALLETIRRHEAIGLHGPEHHGMTAGIMLATWRNLGGIINNQEILRGIERGMKVPGGACGFLGVCGAAAGVGAGLAMILEATPVRPAARSQVMRAVADVMTRQGQFDASRCCQRESWVALRAAAEISRGLIEPALRANGIPECQQASENTECIGKRCPLAPVAHPASRT